MRINGNKEIKFENSRKWLEKELNKPRGKRLIRAYVSMLMNGKIDYKQLGVIYRQDQEIPEASVKRILRYTETQDMINKELEKALSDNNVTLDFLIDKRKEIINLSKDKEKLDIMLKAVEGFEDMYNMRTPIKETKQLTQSFNYKELLENGEKKEITLSQTKELDDQDQAKNS